MQVYFMITTLYFTARKNWEVWRSLLKAQKFIIHHHNIHHEHTSRDIHFGVKISQHILKLKIFPNSLSYQFTTWSGMKQIL